MNTVTVIYGNHPKKMVQQLIEKTDALNRLRAQDSVLIKPNIVVSRKEWTGVNTDPRVVEAIVIALKKRGVSRITVGDGAGMGYSASEGFKICGYHELEDRYGLRLVDLERDRFVKKPVPISGPFKTLEIARSVVESDFLINVPIMKAHGQTKITCSLKNLKGVMPRAMKTRFHGVDLHRAIAQLASVVSVDLIIVDGLKGDLMSETGRTPVQMERILLGYNPVEVDSVVADMLGYQPREISHIFYAAEAGLGSCELSGIRLLALNRPTKTFRFTAPPHFSKRFPCVIDAQGACCTCVGNLIFALERLQEKGMFLKGFRFLVGQKVKFRDKDDLITVAVGQCAVKNNSADMIIDSCPPTTGAIMQSVTSEYSRKH
ncbi:MAG: DUF362 domain-containing protein [Deltaproteobacteria bacterium]|nr:DUF362 domain-containing protein [Deltaproteobacteria bacterium]MBW1962676.1 DUF362 domain-containing protein [Deltaproteobacteria bacterium]MBW1993056.1 DUF362 domain-containing protein [Deltaproteobacteria bacterium]MBW2153348.1 DUF362 domain-containing protein [Deltaproteobacteria bacterium]